MNTALIALELRKNRMALIGLAAAAALIHPISLIVARRQGMDARLALQAAMWWWVIVGLPLSAAIFGAAPGSGLRAAEARAADSPLPVSASGRVFRGLAGALLQFLILILVTAIIGVIVSPGWSAAVFDSPSLLDAKTWIGMMFYRTLVTYFALELISSCFLASYIFGNAVAGGLIGSVAAAAQAAVIMLCLQYHFFFPERVESFKTIIALAALIGIAAKAAAVRPLAARFERSRRLGFGGTVGTFLLLIAGFLCALGAQELAYSQVRSSLRLIKPKISSMLIVIGGPSTEEMEAALFPAVRGADALADTVGGGLIWISPTGSLIRLLGDGEVGRFSLTGPFHTRIDSAAWDETGSLLIARRSEEASGDKIDFWAGRPGTGMHRVDPAIGVPERLAREKGALGIVFRKDFKELFCVLDFNGRAKKCAPYADFASVRNTGTDLLLAARLSKDGLTLTRSGPRAKTWRLPGRAADLASLPETIPAYLIAGKPAYFTTIRIKDDEAVAVCLDDGSVKTAWKHGWSGLRGFGGLKLNVLPDGTLVYQYAYDWNVVDPSGNFLPTIRSKRLFERWPRPASAPPFTPLLVHRAGGHDWIVFEGTRLVEMDESSGMPLKDWPLPAKPWRAGSIDGVRVLEGGLAMQEFAAPFFIGWDGKVRALRAP
jgi:hypothetical protein